MGTIVQYGDVLVTLIIDENQRRKKLAKLFFSQYNFTRQK